MCESSNLLATKLSFELGEQYVFSPLSINYVLSLLHQGSRDLTEEQLTTLLGKKCTINNISECFKVFNNNFVKLANAIIVNDDYYINSEYLNKLAHLAHIQSENFNDPSAVVNNTNKFIEDNTNHLITNVVKEEMITMKTIMLVINTIYFKANWLQKFDPSNTHKRMFNENITMEMMSNESSYSYYEDNHIQAIEMHYEDPAYCMGIILPGEKVKMSDCIKPDINSLVFSQEQVHITIPKFTQRKKINLINSLTKLGLTELFLPTANLSGITSGSAYVSEMIHEAVVTVGELGTEATAVTLAIVTRESVRMQIVKPKYFLADHTFMYYIKHKPSNTLMFIGIYDGTN